MKTKRQPTRRPKTHRTSLDKRITAAKTPQAKMRLALFGRERARNRTEQLVAEWNCLHRLQGELSKLDEGNPRASSVKTLSRQVWASATRSAFEFIRDALHFHQPEMLIELAREMQRQQRGKTWTADRTRFALLKAAERGPVNVSRVANKTGADLRTVRRVAHRIGLFTRPPGRPKK